jgi:crotonobetainyl-CoA:carnitine CoA-transferase CaiB-like acyl-CoA transferase
VGDASLSSPEYRTIDGRRTHADRIDAAIEHWTRTRAAAEVETVLQQAGVSAAAVRSNVDVLAELPRFAPSHRTMTHAVVGEIPVPPNPLHVDGETARVHRAGPRLGEHTVGVLCEVLGMSREAVGQLAADGVLT